MKKVKNIIIGFGKGGKTLAKFLGRRSEEVLVVERSPQMYGGTCINIACLPSKRLITEAAAGTDFTTAINGKNTMTSQLREKNYQMLASEPTVTVLDGQAHFISDHTIEVTTATGESESFTGERIFINTGAQPIIPPIPGLKDSSALLTSTTAMEQTQLPKELVIIGAGYIGLEFAGMFAEFGSAVTVIDHHQQFLPREDEDISREIFKNFQDLGVQFKLGVDIQQVYSTVGQTQVEVIKDGVTEVISADKILAATGRRPVTAELGLENTDIQVDRSGAIKVDDHLHTTVPNVWAIGDVKGGPQFTYISLDDFRIIKDELFGNGQRVVTDRAGFPTTVFIEPPLAQVGLTEKQAQAAGINYSLFKLPVASIPKAKVLKDQRGLLKALVDPETNQILGATLYVEEAQELINLVTLAINAHLPYTYLRDQIYTHPTIAEAFNDLFAEKSRVK